MIASRSFVRLTFAMLAALPMTAQSAASQDTRPTVAVLYFDNNSIGRDAADYAGMGKGVADLLITDLTAAANVRVVERERIEALLHEQNLAKQGQIDPATAVRLGRILGARHMITGGFMSTGDRMVLTARAFDVETGQIVHTQKVSQAGDDVLALIGELSTRLTTSLKLPPVERRTGDAGQAAQQGAHQGAHHAPAKLDLRTALLYSKALEAQDAGDRAKAVELYNQVLDRFPTLESARVNRDKLQASND